MGEPGAISLENIPKRIPILDAQSAKKFPSETIDQQWNLTTEVLKREIQNDHGTREAILPFVSSPVSEDLPDKVINDNIGRIEKRFHKQLGEYLELPAVPDELIHPDITNAPFHLDPQTALEQYATTPYGKQWLDEAIDHGYFQKGITTEERAMVIKRYRLARDIKLLALAGEMRESGPISLDQNNEAKLPSGTQIFMNPRKVADHNELLNPVNWIKRRTIKDRVYEIEVAGKKYILKEKKTARHTDTKRHGHIEGLSSTDEFKTAAFFREHAMVNQDEIKVSWEDPIGYVVFLDGFQFTVFEFEKNFIPSLKMAEILTAAIIRHKDQFEMEFQNIAKEAKKLQKHKTTIGYAEGDPSLSFESFARVKAMYWKDKAKRVLSDIITSNNYDNSDFDGYAYRIHEDPQLTLEIVGMDFEYFSPMDPNESAERLQRGKEFWNEHVLNNGIFMANWWDDRPVSKIEQAAFIAMHR